MFIHFNCRVMLAKVIQHVNQIVRRAKRFRVLVAEYTATHGKGLLKQFAGVGQLA